MRLVAEQAFGSPDLDGLTVAIQGVGHVGACLAEKLQAAGAKLVVGDANALMAATVAERTGAKVVPADAIFDVEADIFSPCALGGSITEETLKRLSARAIVGCANNPLASHCVGRQVFERGIVYAPDYVVNGGGIINVAGEIRAITNNTAFDPAWVEGKLNRLMQTLSEILKRSAAERRPTHELACEIARRRIEQAAEARAAA
jgi:leucine dehydrogenase